RPAFRGEAFPRRDGGRGTRVTPIPRTKNYQENLAMRKTIWFKRSLLAGAVLLFATGPAAAQMSSGGFGGSSGRGGSSLGGGSGASGGSGSSSGSLGNFSFSGGTNTFAGGTSSSGSFSGSSSGGIGTFTGVSGSFSGGTAARTGTGARGAALIPSASNMFV